MSVFSVKKSIFFSLDVVSVVVSSDSEGKLHVLFSKGGPLGVDAAEVGVLEEGDEVSLSGLLESGDGLGLNSHVGVHLLNDLSDDSYEGSSGEKEINALLVSLDFSEDDGTGLESSLSLLSVLGGLNLGNLSLS